MEEGRVERGVIIIIRVRGIGIILINGEVREREERGRDVTAKRVGLVGPVEAVGAPGVAGEGVFGLVVVVYGLVELVWVGVQ